MGNCSWGSGDAGIPDYWTEFLRHESMWEGGQDQVLTYSNPDPDWYARYTQLVRLEDHAVYFYWKPPDFANLADVKYRLYGHVGGNYFNASFTRFRVAIFKATKGITDVNNANAWANADTHDYTDFQTNTPGVPNTTWQGCLAGDSANYLGARQITVQGNPVEGDFLFVAVERRGAEDTNNGDFFLAGIELQYAVEKSRWGKEWTTI